MVQLRSGVTTTQQQLHINIKSTINIDEEKKLITPTNQSTNRHNNSNHQQQIIINDASGSQIKHNSSTDSVECKQQHSDNAATSATAEPNGTTDIYSIFIEWMKDNGARFPYLTLKQYSNNYRGVHIDLSAAQTNNNTAAELYIPKGNTLLHIPYELLISIELVKSTKLGALITAQLNGQIGSQALLAIYLLHERNKSTHSFWSPWINVMPTDFHTLPMYFDSTTLSLLNNCTDLLNKIKSQQKVMLDEYNLIQSCHNLSKYISFTYEEFQWACICVGTRVFSLNINGIKTSVLAPLADMCNHSNPSGTSWSWDTTRNAFVLNSCKILYDSDQVYESYGIKCNRRFFASYGFVVDNNQHNEINVCIDDRHKKHIYSLKAQYDTLFDELIIFVRTLIHTTKHTSSQLSIDNELQSIQYIHHNLLQHMNQYDTTIEQDQYLLQQSYIIDNINHYNCIMYRLGEKRVYQYWIEFCKVTIELLNLPIPNALHCIQQILCHTTTDHDQLVEHARSVTNYNVYLNNTMLPLLNEVQFNQRKQNLYALAAQLDSTKLHAALPNLPQHSHHHHQQQHDVDRNDSMSISSSTSSLSTLSSYKLLHDMDISLTESEIVQYLQMDRYNTPEQPHNSNSDNNQHTNNKNSNNSAIHRTLIKQPTINTSTSTSIREQQMPQRSQTQPNNTHSSGSTSLLPTIIGKQLIAPSNNTHHHHQPQLLPTAPLPRLIVASPTLQPSVHSRRLFDTAQYINNRYNSTAPISTIHTSDHNNHTVPQSTRSLIPTTTTKTYHMTGLTVTSKILNPRATTTDEPTQF